MVYVPRRFVEKFRQLARISARGYVAYAHDIVMAAVSFALSLYLRLGDVVYYYSPALLVQGTILFTVIAAGVFWYMGLYRGVWRYASLNDLLAITRATAAVVLIFLVVMFLWTRLETLPRSTLIINWFVLTALLGGPRFFYRLLKSDGSMVYVPRRFVEKFRQLARISARGYVAYAHDIVMAAVSFALSLYLRLGDVVYYYSPALLVQGTILFTVIAAGVFWYMGLYRGVWRYASLNDLLAITRATAAVVLIFLVVMFLWTRLETLPRSTLIINWFVLTALLGGPRFFYRLLKDRRFDFELQDEGHRRVPVLLVGAGDGAELFIRASCLNFSTNRLGT